MKKFFSAIVSGILCFSVLQAQSTYTGQPGVAIGGSHSVTIPCGSSGGGCYHASSVRNQTGYTTTYTVDSIPHILFPLGTPTIVPTTADDVWSGIIQIPFNFCFFGNNYSSLLIGSNGIVTFDSTMAGLTCPWELNGLIANSNLPIPNPALPMNSIMAPYQDIYPPAGGTITYSTLGQAPRRIFLISYNQVPQYSCTTIASTSQIALYEGTNIIDVYIDTKVLCSTWNDGNAIEGIQNIDGTLAYSVIGRNNTQWVTTNEGRRFTPSFSRTTATAVKWHMDQSNVVISTTDSAVLCPPSNATTKYIVDVTYIECDTTHNIVVSDTISIAVTQSAGPDQYLSCPTAVDSVMMAGTGTGTWTAVPTNPSATTIVSPTSGNTVIRGFGPVGTYYFVWASAFCVDTAAVIVSSRPDAGPDVFTCVHGTATMAAIGTGTWTAMAGNPIPVTITSPNSPTTTITGFTIGGTYNFIWSFAGCSDTATVNVPVFAITATGDTSLCKYLTTTISVSAGPPSLGPFTYLWLDSTLVQSPHAAITAIDPLLNTTDFQIQVTSAGGCVLLDTVHVVLSGVAPRISLTPSNTNVCPGDVITLNSTVLVANLVSCGLVQPYDTCPDNSLLNIGAVGTGGSSTSYESPYSGLFSSAKTQYLITAAEMNAAGLSSGAITDLSFFATQISSTVGYDSFAISIGCTNLTTLTGFVNSVIEVAPPSQITPNLGWSPHPFTHFYNWDGVSNLVVQVCYTRTSASSNNSDAVAYTTTSYPGSVAYARSFGNSTNGCNLGNPGFSALRPNIRFGMCAPNVLKYQWSPSTLACDTCPTTQVAVTSDSTYRLVVSDNGCVNDSTVRVTVNPYIAIHATPDTSLCNHDSVQLNVTLTNPPAAYCLQNYSVSSIPYAAITGTQIAVPGSSYSPTSDDGYAGPFNIGFSFPFYCESFSQFWVSANGFISFVPPSSSGLTAQTLPPSAADLSPEKIIVPVMGDYELAPLGAGNIKYFVSGTLPNRIFVVKFNGMRSFSGTFTTTAELHLYEGSGIVDIMIASSTYANRNHTTGIKDTVGLGLAAPGRNNTLYTITTPEGWRFLPQNGPSVIINNIVWSPNTSLSNDTIVNPYASPTTGQDYVANVNLLINQFTNPEVCAVKDTATVRVGSFQHTLTATPSVTCAGANAQLTFSTTDSVSSYSWTPTVLLSNASISNPVATVNDTTTFVVTAVDTNNCKVKDSVTISTYPHQNLSLSGGGTICYTDSARLGLAGSYTSFQWYTIDTATGQTTPVATTPTISGFPSRYYVLRVQDSATSCILTTDTIHVDSFAHPILLVTASGPLAFCSGGNVVLQTDQGYTGYQWSPAGGGGQAIPVTTSGNYSYVATDANSCIRFSDTARVVVSSPPSIAFAPYRTVICTGDVDSFTLVTNPPGVPVTWTLGGAQVASGDTFFTSTPGTYTITASQGCPTDSAITLTVATSPTLTLSPDSSICSCHPLYVVTASASSPVSYAWSTGTTDSTYTVDAVGNHVYRVTVSDAHNCTATGTVTVNVSCLQVGASVLPSDTAYVNASFGLVADSVQQTATLTYHWYPDSTLGTPTGSVTKGTTLGSQPIDTFYLATLDHATGCRDTSFVIITVINHGGLRMPTAFTPNSDGKNEIFYPVLAVGSKVTTFRIYNRWGETLHDDPMNGWNGVFSGNPQASDTYTYFVTVESPDPLDATKKVQKSVEGSFQLFR